jgi:hypothetical protein
MKQSFLSLISAIALSVIVFALIQCGPKNASSLAISVNPSQPIIIDQGSTLTLANGDTVSPPYFSVNNFKVTWSSTSSSAQILALKFVTTGTGTNSECAFSGLDIESLFAGATYPNPTAGQPPITASLVNNGVVTIPAVVNNNVLTYTTNGLIYCGGLQVTNTTNNTIYSSYNVPMAVALYGQTIDASGNASGRLTAVTNITLQ